jgi:hypothetical protein
MDGDLKESRDFVAVLMHQTGDASMYYNTDALSLGMAVKMIAKAFVECVSQCTLEEQQQIESILGDAFILERLRADEEDRG